MSLNINDNKLISSLKSANREKEILKEKEKYDNFINQRNEKFKEIDKKIENVKNISSDELICQIQEQPLLFSASLFLYDKSPEEYQTVLRSIEKSLNSLPPFYIFSTNIFGALGKSFVTGRPHAHAQFNKELRSFFLASHGFCYLDQYRDDSPLTILLQDKNFPSSIAEALNAADDVLFKSAGLKKDVSKALELSKGIAPKIDETSIICNLSPEETAIYASNTLASHLRIETLLLYPDSNIIKDILNISRIDKELFDFTFSTHITSLFRHRKITDSSEFYPVLDEFYKNDLKLSTLRMSEKIFLAKEMSKDPALATMNDPLTENLQELNLEQDFFKFLNERNINYTNILKYKKDFENTHQTEMGILSGDTLREQMNICKEIFIDKADDYPDIFSAFDTYISSYKDGSNYLLPQLLFSVICDDPVNNDIIFPFLAVRYPALYEDFKMHCTNSARDTFMNKYFENGGQYFPEIK